MLTQKQQRHLAELAFIRSIADKELDEKKIKNGRLKGLFLKLQKTIDKEFIVLDLWPSPIDTKAIEIKIDKLRDIIGLREEEFSVVAMSSFCLGFIEHTANKINPFIVDALIDIIDYFERGGRSLNNKEIDYRDGQSAADIWIGLFE